MEMLYVTYPGDETTRFDRNYYVETHLPLVLDSWCKYGLKTVAAFFPEGSGQGTIAICVCNFIGKKAMRDSFASPEAREVMSDVRHFTDAIPTQTLTTPL